MGGRVGVGIDGKRKMWEVRKEGIGTKKRQGSRCRRKYVKGKRKNAKMNRLGGGQAEGIGEKGWNGRGSGWSSKGSERRAKECEDEKRVN